MPRKWARRDLIRQRSHDFLRIARRSASEVQSQAYLALDQAYVTEDSFRCVYDEATAAKKLINGMLSYLEGRTSD